MELANYEGESKMQREHKLKQYKRDLEEGKRAFNASMEPRNISKSRETMMGAEFDYS